MDTANSQKKSPRSSTKNERQQRAGEDARPRHRPSWMSPNDVDQYMDGSPDLVARIRQAREAAQREMESFGDVSEYEVTILQGQAKDEPRIEATQSALAFEDGENGGSGDAA